MKKTALLFLIFMTAAGFAFAADILQYPPPLKGGNVLVDIGLGYADWGNSPSWKMKIPPLVAAGEYCLPVGIPVSVGGMFAFSQFGWSYTGGHDWTYTDLIFAGRGNWHWNIDLSWLDLYTGVNLGYKHFSVKYDGPDQIWADLNYSWNYSGLYWGIQAGAHFYFTNYIGLALEGGWPVYAKAALALKF